MLDILINTMNPLLVAGLMAQWAKMGFMISKWKFEYLHLMTFVVAVVVVVVVVTVVPVDFQSNILQFYCAQLKFVVKSHFSMPI